MEDNAANVLDPKGGFLNALAGYIQQFQLVVQTSTEQLQSAVDKMDDEKEEQQVVTGKATEDKAAVSGNAIGQIVTALSQIGMPNLLQPQPVQVAAAPASPGTVTPAENIQGPAGEQDGDTTPEAIPQGDDQGVLQVEVTNPDDFPQAEEGDEEEGLEEEVGAAAPASAKAGGSGLLGMLGTLGMVFAMYAGKKIFDLGQKVFSAVDSAVKSTANWAGEKLHKAGSWLSDKWSSFAGKDKKAEPDANSATGGNKKLPWWKRLKDRAVSGAKSVGSRVKRTLGFKDKDTAKAEGGQSAKSVSNTAMQGAAIPPVKAEPVQAVASAATTESKEVMTPAAPGVVNPGMPQSKPVEKTYAPEQLKPVEKERATLDKRSTMPEDVTPAMAGSVADADRVLEETGYVKPEKGKPEPSTATTGAKKAGDITPEKKSWWERTKSSATSVYEKTKEFYKSGGMYGLLKGQNKEEKDPKKIKQQPQGKLEAGKTTVGDVRAKPESSTMEAAGEEDGALQPEEPKAKGMLEKAKEGVMSYFPGQDEDKATKSANAEAGEEGPVEVVNFNKLLDSTNQINTSVLELTEVLENKEMGGGSSPAPASSGGGGGHSRPGAASAFRDSVRRKK